MSHRGTVGVVGCTSARGRAPRALGMAAPRRTRSRQRPRQHHGSARTSLKHSRATGRRREGDTRHTTTRSLAIQKDTTIQRRREAPTSTAAARAGATSSATGTTKKKKKYGRAPAHPDSTTELPAPTPACVCASARPKPPHTDAAASHRGGAGRAEGDRARHANQTLLPPTRQRTMQCPTIGCGWGGMRHSGLHAATTTASRPRRPRCGPPPATHASAVVVAVSARAARGARGGVSNPLPSG